VEAGCFPEKVVGSNFFLVANCKDLYRCAVLGKIIKIVAARCHSSKLKCTKKIDFGWGSATYPAGGAYSAPPDTTTGFKGPTSKVREGRKHGRKRQGGRREGRERDVLLRRGERAGEIGKLLPGTEGDGRRRSTRPMNEHYGPSSSLFRTVATRRPWQLSRSEYASAGHVRTRTHRRTHTLKT